MFGLNYHNIMKLKHIKNTKKQCFNVGISDGFLKFLKSLIIIYFSMIQRQYMKTNQISQTSWDKSVQTKEQINDKPFK